MPETLLSYLTRPNPRIARRAQGPVKFTFNNLWLPVENLEPWTEFNYETLMSLFGPDLSRQVDLDDPTPQCEASMFSQIYDEQTLGHVVASSIMIPVSCALPQELFAASGGITWETDDCFPDWSAGNQYRMQEYQDPEGTTVTKDRPKAIVLGDTKYQWSHEEAIRNVCSRHHGYEHTRPNNVLPLEQVQFYCAMYRCRFGFLVTDEGLLVLEAFQETDIQRSPRPRRNVRPPSHQRVISSSTVDMSISGLSEAVSDLSVRSADVGPPSIRLMKYAFVPWRAQGTGALTVKLALYCIVRIANEDSGLRPHYTPLTTMVQLSGGASATPIGGSPEPSTTVGKDKAPAVGSIEPVTSTSNPRTSNESQYHNVRVFWNNDHTAYNYQIDDGKWIFNDSPEKWQTLENNIYNYHMKPPLRGNKPS
ncbi:hypothetical protein BDV25DRAFT_164122 [Aspergillus avenaceus]|uniref:Uncharacterized protein n=1 Tax=Aspergillus avenaceus TaxID=36643 RepID=A0A5N6THF0_ASPAV|nr:hypothetical protein BDV25DRAFT_164122 [Aspergillus avenaceus]